MDLVNPATRQTQPVAMPQQQFTIGGPNNTDIFEFLRMIMPPPQQVPYNPQQPPVPYNNPMAGMPMGGSLFQLIQQLGSMAAPLGDMMRPPEVNRQLPEEEARRWGGGYAPPTPAPALGPTLPMPDPSRVAGTPGGEIPPQPAMRSPGVLNAMTERLSPDPGAPKGFTPRQQAPQPATRKKKKKAAPAPAKKSATRREYNTDTNKFEDKPQTVNNAALRREGARRIEERRAKREG